MNIQCKPTPVMFFNEPATTIPDAPSDLVITAISATQCDLAWTDNSNNEAWFEVHAALDGSAFALLAYVGANDTDWSELISFTTYQRAYKVLAHAAIGDSAFTNTVYTPPVAPTITAITAPGVLNVEFEFTHPDQSGNAWVQGYTVEARNVTQASAWEIVGTLPPGHTAAVQVDATPMTPSGVDGDSISVRIRAYKGAQIGPWSNTMSATINA